MKKKTSVGTLASKLVLPILAVAVLCFFLVSLTNLDSGRREEGKLRLEEAIRRSAVACYAVEGIYPPDLEYLQQYYGLQIDESKYLVIYEAFAENLMPDITVQER